MGRLKLNEQAWVADEFAGADLGDERRSRRLQQVAIGMAQNPQGTIYGALQTAADCKAAYRLFGREEVTHQAVLAPHVKRTFERCCQTDEVLLIEDSTSLNYTSHKATSGLGRIGDDRNTGLFLHNTLAMGIHNWNGDQEPEVLALGVFQQHCWARTMPTIGTGKEKRRDRLSRPRESERWAEAFVQQGGPPPNVQWTLVADREADVYEALQKCDALGVDFIIRANQPRRLHEQADTIFSAVAGAEVKGAYVLPLRARPGQKARVAKIEVRTTQVTLRGAKRLNGRLEPFTLNVVEAREIDPPADVEAPIKWVLSTSWPVDDFQAALRVINAYATRWVIEEYHKVLKTGTGVERSQLENGQGLQALIGVMSIVAVWLLNLKFLAQTQPALPVTAESLPEEALQVLETKTGKPKGGWTSLTVLVAIAKLGGFWARKGDGLPGWQIIWRGWNRLILLAEGARLAREWKT